MRIAIFGAGHPFASECLRALPAMSQPVEVVGLVEAAAEGAVPAYAGMASEFGVRWYASADELPHERLDAVIVGGAIDRRPKWLQSAAERAEHVLCGVPFGATYAGAEAVARHCAARGAHLYPAWVWHYLPVMQSLKSMIIQGSLGRLLSFNLQHRARRCARPDDESSIRETLQHNVVQAIRLLGWLGDADVADLHAEIGHGLLHPGGVVDGAIVSLALSSGAYATLDVCLSLPPTFPAPEDLQLETIGTGGWVRVDAYRQHIEAYGADGAEWGDWGSQPVVGLLEAFFDAVRKNRTEAPIEEALRPQRLAQSVLDGE